MAIISSPRSSKIRCKIALMRGAFRLAKPACRIAFAIRAGGARRTSSQSRNRRRNSSYAGPLFVSDVFCDSTVAINSSNTGHCSGGSTGPYTLRSRRQMVATAVRASLEPCWSLGFLVRPFKSSPPCFPAAAVGDSI